MGLPAEMQIHLRVVCSGKNQPVPVLSEPLLHAHESVKEAGLLSTELQNADSDRHVLLISVDHWPADWLACAGHPWIQTPTLDQLARNGVRFSNAYSECPVCIPARRSLMTGTPPRTHGDRTFQTTLPMPELPTLAQTFRNAGYQAYGVGKLHVYPQRDRIGFDDVQLCEEGRPYWGVVDDYESFLGDRGVAGRQFDHGMSNNEYVTRPWHLPEECHPTNWTARTMSQMIRRRDPTRPGFWYLSFTHPHPPLVPLEQYWNMYAGVEIDAPATGEWAEVDEAVPFRVAVQQQQWSVGSSTAVNRALWAFAALCTHIDHQIRLVIGTLREEGLLENTVLAFTSDHGDMLGQHGLWAKRLFYERSANVPMIVCPAMADSRLTPGRVDDRLVGLQDMMPTLLDLAGLPIPDSVDGQSMFGGEQRNSLYGECNEGAMGARMLRAGQYKLLYYPAGNVTQLFDLESDPEELRDLSADAEYQRVKDELTKQLTEELYGDDLSWLQDGELRGIDVPELDPASTRDLLLQRGVHWPPPPQQVIRQEPNRLR